MKLSLGHNPPRVFLVRTVLGRRADPTDFPFVRGGRGYSMAPVLAGTVEVGLREPSTVSVCEHRVTSTALVNGQCLHSTR